MGGSSLLHRSVAKGHLVWNLQPDGGSRGDGTSPVRMILSDRLSGLIPGTAESNALV